VSQNTQEWQIKLASSEKEKKLMMKKQEEKGSSSPAGLVAYSNCDYFSCANNKT